MRMEYVSKENVYVSDYRQSLGNVGAFVEQDIWRRGESRMFAGLLMFK